MATILPKTERNVKEDTQQGVLSRFHLSRPGHTRRFGHDALLQNALLQIALSQKALSQKALSQKALSQKALSQKRQVTRGPVLFVADGRANCFLDFWRHLFDVVYFLSMFSSQGQDLVVGFRANDPIAIKANIPAIKDFGHLIPP
jgi:hypothetical protein